MVDAIYDTVRPDGVQIGAKPIIVFQEIAGTATTVLQGDISYRERNFQISVFADRYKLTSGRDVREAVIAALQNYREGSFKGATLTSHLHIPPSPELQEHHFPIDFKFTT